MKKILLVLLAFSMLLPMAIFANGQKDSSGGVVKIEFFQRKREVVDLFDQIIQKFESENPGIKVEQIHVSDHDQVLASRLAANDVPDVLTHWPNKSDYVQSAMDGFFVDLTGDPITKNVVPAIIDQITLKNGKNYGVPISVNTQGIFYNKDLFDKNGLTVPKTWDELMTLAKKIKSMGGTPFLWPDGTDWTLEQQLRMLLNLDADGEKLMDDIQSGKVKTQDVPVLQKIAQEFFTLRGLGQENSLGTTYEQACQEFATGNSFMFWQGIWAIPNIMKANPDMNVRMFALPSYTGMETRVEYGVDLCLVVGNTGDEKKMAAAKKFVAFVATPEIAQLYADSDGSPSAIKGVVFKNKISKPLVDMVQAGKAFRNVRYRWAVGGTERSRTATQQLLVDKNVDKWLEELNYVFGQPDYK